MLVTRRTFLGVLAGGAALSLAPRAVAAATRAVIPSERGTTFTFELEHAPFPHGGSPHQDRSVLVFVPEHFRVERAGRVPLLVHFHGHNTTAEKAIVSHELREQLFDSRQNAVLVVPQGPVNAPDSSAGKLDTPGGFARLVSDVLGALGTREVRRAIPNAFGRAPLRAGNICLSAHSGGYHAAAACAKHGGLDVNEIYLFDALYGDLEVFRDWVRAGRGKSMRERHKLVSYYGPGATEANSTWLLAELEKSSVRCAYERVEGTLSREDLVRSDAVFVRTQLSHNGVTHELNALRDCLYASGLPRHLTTAWFDAKAGARRLERRR